MAGSTRLQEFERQGVAAPFAQACPERPLVAAGMAHGGVAPWPSLSGAGPRGRARVPPHRERC
jgi:hypothetical protein